MVSLFLRLSHQRMSYFWKIRYYLTNGLDDLGDDWQNTIQMGMTDAALTEELVLFNIKILHHV